VAGAAGSGEEMCFDAVMAKLGGVGWRESVATCPRSGGAVPGLEANHGVGDRSAGEDVGGGGSSPLRAGWRVLVDGH